MKKYICSDCERISNRVYVYHYEELINKYEIDEKGNYTLVDTEEVYRSIEEGKECIYCGSAFVNEVEE